MNNLEWLKSMKDIQEMGNELCRITEDCGRCPCEVWCSLGHNGYIDWFMQEHKEVEYGDNK